MTAELITEHVEPVRSRKRPGSVRYWRDAERTELVSGTCRDCGELTPAADLARDAKRPGTRALWCLACIRTASNDRYATDPARRAAQAARHRRNVETGEEAARKRRERARLRSRTVEEIRVDQARLRPTGVKSCRSCAAFLPLAEFYANVNNADGLHDSCRRCDNAKTALARSLPSAERRDVWTCAYCSAPAEHGDHVHSRNREGLDVVENLVPACGTCNTSKNDSDLFDWRPDLLDLVKDWPVEIREIAELEDAA